MKPATPFRRPVLALFGGLLVLALCLSAGRAARAQDLHVLSPVEGAIVRETVPVKIAAGDLPDNGYVGVTIDGQFQTARVLPDNKNAPVFDWDTKAPYTTPDDPATPKYVTDGKHTLKLDVYDKGGTLKGTATINIQVANKITTAATGITLAYHWTKDLQLRYSRVFQLDTVPSDASGASGAGTSAAGENLQAASLKFSRSVEDISGGDYLVRDDVLSNVSYIGSKGQAQRMDALYNLKSKYRTVDAQGNVLSVMAPFTNGQHVAFSIPVLAPRRVAIGDSWQAPVQLALEWASLEPTKVMAESRLEGFEWQNGYPCAKIREKYSGPVTYKLLGGTSVDITNVNYERVIFFAYGSGRLIRTETTTNAESVLTSAQISALGVSGGSQGGGYPGGGYPGGGDEEGVGGYPGAAYPGGGYPGGGYPGGGYGGGSVTPAPPPTTKLKATAVTNIIS